MNLAKLTAHYEKNYLKVDEHLNRNIVSFAENRNLPIFRWFKFKEAFAPRLVQYLLDGLEVGTLLDPFAGTCTTLFTAAYDGWKAQGIELMPFHHALFEARIHVESGLSTGDISTLETWAREPHPWQLVSSVELIPEYSITEGAFPPSTAYQISNFRAAMAEECPAVRSILQVALLAVLEDVSYTVKSGQFLRWDNRSGHSSRGKFQKKHIANFTQAMKDKLTSIIQDIKWLYAQPELLKKANIGGLALHCGSCFGVLPTIQKESVDCILTSPPYLNRYDYTRTYALEMAFSGVSEDGLKAYRQAMLSCTVENKSKDLLWRGHVMSATWPYLEEILEQLRGAELNNANVVKMVERYFMEMSFVIWECYKVMKRGAKFFMVNDNVRYGGVSIPVDIILSEAASNLGFAVEKILVLPGTKGNSSQQMGEHGQDRLRKCIYVWRKI